MSSMQVFTIVLELLGGLGLFLFGMKTMSDAIERTAGAKLRPILEKFTSNKFLGLIVGAVFTALVQSSSACTSMVVSFVDSGLMNLYQAVGVPTSVPPLPHSSYHLILNSSRRFFLPSVSLCICLLRKRRLTVSVKLSSASVFYSSEFPLWEMR